MGCRLFRPVCKRFFYIKDQKDLKYYNVDSVLIHDPSLTYDAIQERSKLPNTFDLIGS
jgi:hypothetical protein